MTSTSKPGSATERVVPHTRIEDESMIEETYAMGRKLGQGSFGVVREATNNASKRKWAIKAISKDFKDKDRTSALKLLEREVAILKRVHHEHIIHMEEVFETSKKIYLVMELCEGGELADVLKSRKTFTEHDAKVVIQKLTSAIKYLHKNDIVHRDLKLENILLTENPDDPDDKLHIKVTDFGLSVVKDGIGHDSMMQAFCGTPIYMSPEIIDNKTYSQQCDIWATGVIMYMLLCGSPPFKARDEEQLYIIIKRGQLDFSGPAWKNVSEEAKNLLHGMFKVDPAHRLTASEILAHPWFTGDKLETSGPSNVLEMMKQWKDELRLGQTEDDLDADSAINGDQGDENNKTTTNGSSTNSSKLSLSSSGSDRCQKISNERNNVTASPSRTSNKQDNRAGYSPASRGRKSQTSGGSSSPSTSSKNNSPSSGVLLSSNQRNSSSTGRATPPKHAAKTSATAITKPASSAQSSKSNKTRKK